MENSENFASDGIGDLRGIADKLQYLKDLGITATWLSPIYKSPLIDYGYDISDFYAIGPEYGTMEDFEYLMAKSKETGVKVILDFVPNHTSDENEWFEKSVNSEEPYKDFYVWHPGKVDPNDATTRIPPCNWQSIGGKKLGDAWTWNDKRQAFYYHQFAVKQPDLNFRNPKVHDEMKNVLKFWLDKGVAGFRVDAITHMYEVQPSADNSLPDEPVSGTTDDTSDYGYLKHVYTADQNETFDLVYEWREFLDNYVKENGADTK
jgi:alpha-glucosidase